MRLADIFKIQNNSNTLIMLSLQTFNSYRLISWVSHCSNSWLLIQNPPTFCSIKLKSFGHTQKHVNVVMHYYFVIISKSLVFVITTLVPEMWYVLIILMEELNMLRRSKSNKPKRQTQKQYAHRTILSWNFHSPMEHISEHEEKVKYGNCCWKWAV